MGVLSMITACVATGLLLLGLDCCRIWEGKIVALVWNYLLEIILRLEPNYGNNFQSVLYHYSTQFKKYFLENPRRKLYVMRFGIFILLISGILLSGVSIFYAAFIKREFSWWKNIPQHTVNTDFIIFDYGGCIYAAFILGLLNYILVFMLFQVKKGSILGIVYGSFDSFRGIYR